MRALAWVDSGCQPLVVSPAGALGVMQVMPSTWAWVEEVALRRRVPNTAAGSALVGITCLSHLLDEFGAGAAARGGGRATGPAFGTRDGRPAGAQPFVNAVLDLSRRV